MRNIRFELSGDSDARRSLPPGFVDVRFDLRKPGGFDALRDVYRCFQRQKLPVLDVWFRLAKNVPWFARAIWWRYVHRRLLFPKDARLIVHAVIAQTAEKENCISLSRTRRDRYGVPLAEINWRVSDRDVSNLELAARLFRDTWRATGLSRYGEWKQFANETIARSAREEGAFLHPSGSTRLGHNASEAVVDRDLRLFSLPQIQLLSTSVLPTAGGANPTMMLMLLAMRSVDQYVKRYGSAAKNPCREPE